jgi:hypothetical protein
MADKKSTEVKEFNLSLGERFRGKADIEVPKPINPVEWSSKIVELSNGVMTKEDIDKISKLISEERGEYKKYRNLYRKDSLTFAIINKFVSKIAGQGIQWSGDEDLIKKMTTKDISFGFKFKAMEMVLRAMLGGTCWLELVPNKASNDLESIKFLDPDNTDFIRDTDGYITMDEFGDIKGFKMNIRGKTVYWYADKVTTAGTKIKDGITLIERKGEEDLRKRIVWIKLLSSGDIKDEELGMPIMAPLYRSAIIRTNVADAIGEAGFRGGGMQATYTGSPPENAITEMENNLKNITAHNVMMHSDRWTLGLLPIPDMEHRENLLKYLADEQCGGSGIPLDVILSSANTYKQDLGSKLADMEQTMMNFQEFLSYQINNKIISYMKSLWNADNKVLSISFTSRNPAIKVQNARSINSLAKSNLIKPDPELEKHLRKKEELPYSFLDEQIKQHKEQQNNPLAIVQQQPQQQDVKSSIPPEIEQ